MKKVTKIEEAEFLKEFEMNLHLTPMDLVKK
jgi:hypothetical protein